MEPEQSSMTVIVPVVRGKEEDLKALLRKIGSDIENNPYIRFAQFPAIHFARWVVIPPPDPDDPGEPKGPSDTTYLLAFGTDHDGPDEALLRELAQKAMTALDRVYSYCRGWPGPADT